MQQERFKMIAFVSLILRRGSEVLLIRRFNTGSEDGMYSCAGGGVDENEPVTQALVREAHEELGINIKKENLKVVHIVHRKNTKGVETIGFVIEACKWEGEPCNMEPHKCDDLQWFDINKLPDNCHPAFKHVVSMLEQQKFFSEMGWE
jgi:ADP-ribose pyrophosphatase YjhB (NUDIX family)